MDHVHPYIRNFMTKYYQKFGNLKLKKILQYSNVTYDQMPRLPNYTKNGQSTLCWHHVLGQCNPMYCKRKDGHATAREIPDAFAQGVCQVISPGIDYVYRNESPRPPKRKHGGQ